MNKKGLLKLIFTITTFILLTGCGKAEKTAAETPTYTEDNILLLIQEANTREAYLKNNERIAYENIYY